MTLDLYEASWTLKDDVIRGLELYAYIYRNLLNNANLSDTYAARQLVRHTMIYSNGNHAYSRFWFGRAVHDRGSGGEGKGGRASVHVCGGGGEVRAGGGGLWAWQQGEIY